MTTPVYRFVPEAPLPVPEGLVELSRFAVQPRLFYRLDFEARASVPGYWVVDFFDAADHRLYADNYSAVDAAPDWAWQTSMFMSRAAAATARLAFRPTSAPLAIRQAQISPASRAEVLAWMDAMDAGLPPIGQTAPPDFWQHLPRTRALLRAGGGLRMVVLGDSVANDLLNGHPQLLLERRWPGSEVTAIHATEPEKGCPGYQHNGCVERYALRHEPDLLVVAGMSYGGDADAVCNVVAQARAGRPDLDILVVTVSVFEAGGNSSEQLRPFLDRLQTAAATQHFAVADLRRPWEEFVARSPQPVTWYKRDSHHANDRGKHVLARLFAGLFEPSAGGPA